MMRVVDKDVVEFIPKGRPLSVDIMEFGVEFAKFELRTINKQFLPHPDFSDGDISVVFSDGSSLRTHRALLSLSSHYIAKRCFDTAVDALDVGHFSRHDFEELLLQLYPTRRPLWGDFRALNRAALAFKVDHLIYSLSTHLINFNRRPMSIVERLSAAMKEELHPAVEELVFRAAQDGTWGKMIGQGFEPEAFFTPTIYKQIVCPAVISARQRQYRDSPLRDPFAVPDFFTDKSDINCCVLLFRNTPFHVNKGILAVHGVDAFERGSNGEYLAVFSKEMQNECAMADLIPGEVVTHLLTSLYPGGPSVTARLLRAAIVFCHDHHWNVAKEDLEQMLLLKPTITVDEYLGQLQFAERFGMENMLRNCIHRAESSCHQLASYLVGVSSSFTTLSPETRDRLKDRLCSGWGIDPPHINKLGMNMPTSFRERQVLPDGRGGAAGRDYDNEGTLVEMMSEYHFGDVKELVLV